MIYQFIENLSRMIMEWAIRRQHLERFIVEEIRDTYSCYKPLKKLEIDRILEFNG